MNGYLINREWQIHHHPVSGIECHDYVGWHADQSRDEAQLLGRVIRRRVSDGWAWYILPTYGYHAGKSGYLQRASNENFDTAKKAVLDVLGERIAQGRLALQTINTEEVV